jgi:hypothetical protein
MQKIVGQSDIEHYPTIGIINKLDADMATSSIDEFQRTLNLGHFVLTNYTSGVNHFSSLEEKTNKKTNKISILFVFSYHILDKGVKKLKISENRTK